MLKIVCVGLAAAAVLALGACTTESEHVSKREDLLAAAGFTVRPADTPVHQAELSRLPPQQFVRQASGDQVTYLYADPSVCGCVYVGDQVAYGRYRREEFEREIAREREQTALLNQQANFEWDRWEWGPLGWGPR
jgi:hypothetical protein